MVAGQNSRLLGWLFLKNDSFLNGLWSKDGGFGWFDGQVWLFWDGL